MADVRDRDVTVERAEALQAWLAGFPLSGRAKGALQRELEAIIADGPSGDHPLAGLTIAEFITTLHLPNGGDVGRVKSVGEGVLKELRAAIPVDTRAPRKARKPAKAGDTAETRPRRRRASEEPAPNGTAPTHGTEPVEETASAPEPVVAPEVAAEAPQVEALVVEVVQVEAQPAPRRRGRPKKAAQSSADAAQQAPAPAQKPTEALAEAVAAEPVVTQEAAQKRRPGRPRRAEALETPGQAALKAAPVMPVEPVVGGAIAPVSEIDPVLAHIIRLWPSFHLQARRAIVYYASDLLAGMGHEG